jgi:hypothetical protein
MGAQLDAARAAVDDVTTGRCKDALLALAGRVDTLEANLREQLSKAEAALEEAEKRGEGAGSFPALEGAVDAWRIALGYFDYPLPAVPDDTLDRTTRYCGACRHEEGAHWPSTGCAETGCKCQGFR